MIYYMIYMSTTIGLPPGGSSTVHIYTKTIRRTTQNKQCIEQYKNFGRVQTVPRLSELYPGIFLTTDKKTWKNLSQGSRTIRIHRINKFLYPYFSSGRKYSEPCLTFEVRL
jgi:hypothetical protein